MPEHIDDADQGRNGSAITTNTSSRSTADKRAEDAVEDVKENIVAGQIGTDARSIAANLYRETGTFLGNSDEVSRATAELRDSIRRNPLAAVGIAIAAGFVLALLTRR